ncbi:hypothetical protein ABIE01_002102 [Lactococcus lactis]
MNLYSHLAKKIKEKSEKYANILKALQVYYFKL